MDTNFNLTESIPTKDDGWVRKRGLIFRADSYPDKRFEMSPEEILAAAADFKPVPLDIEHMPSIFDNKLGMLEAVIPSEDGWELYGVAKIPKWLDDVHGDEPLKVSCTWGKDDKSLKKLALTVSPRVDDAALMAAFTSNRIESGDEDEFKNGVLDFMEWFKKSSSWTGKYTIQNIHDIVSSAGAVCTEMKDEDKEFVSAKEAQVFQQIHDMTVKNGAKCNLFDPNEKDRYAVSEYSNEEENTMKVNELLEGLKRVISALPEDAKLSADEVVEEVSEGSVASADAAPADAVSDAVVEAEGDKTSELSDSIEALKAQLAEAEAELSRAKAEAEDTKQELTNQILDREATEFAEKLVADGIETPATAEFAKKLYLLAAQDDSVALANFNSTEVSRLDAVKEFFGSKQGTKMTEEVLADSVLLSSKSKTSEEDDLSEASRLAKEYAEKVNRKSQSVK